MSIDIKAPEFPESVADGTIATWYKKPGEAVKRDELIVDIETDKVVLEVVAPADGALENILKNEGDIVLSQEVIATFAKGAVADAATTQSADTTKADVAPVNANAPASPAARKLAEENNIDTTTIAGTGKGGLVTKDDVQGAISSASSAEPSPAKSAAPAVEDTVNLDGRPERRVPMTRMRARIAERLLTATQETAMLTTFNEVNMKPVMELRSRYKALFEKTHNGTRLGFMSLFVRAATEALKRFPAVNASIDGNDIVYHGYQDIGVAVSTDRGLVVPVLRDTNYMSLADIEAKIREYGAKGRDGKLSIDEITGGTFSITNGGVFGSMMSTPILNPPQAAILGMHAITERAMVVDGEVTVLPMMYLALSYDHRLIDGKEAVQFLVLIKELLEDPARILLDV